MKPIFVSSDRDFIDELTEDTMNYLNSNEGFQMLTQDNRRDNLIHRDKLPRDVSRLFEIHPEKLPYEIRRQMEKFYHEGWLRVDSRFAMFYMTLLANKICDKTGLALLTNDLLSSNLADKVKLDNQIAINNRDYDFHYRHRREQYLNLNQGILTNLIIEGIKIKSDTTLEDVIRFKEAHKDELGSFRSNMGKLIKSVEKDGRYNAVRQEIEDIYRDDFMSAYNNLKKSLDSFGIKWVSVIIMKMSMFSVPSTAVPMALGFALPQALVAGTGISMIASIVSYNSEKKEKLRNSPYSYLLSIKRNL